MESHSANPTTRLFVGSLPYRFTEGQLLTLFIPFGKVVSIRITATPWGKNRGFGYVEFDNLESAVKAKESMHNSIVEGRSIIVDYAKPDPFATEEGKKRHLEALKRNPKKFRRELGTDGRPERRDAKPGFKGRKFGPRPSGRSGSSEPMRQSVYDSRQHHSRTGAKFAHRTRTKK